MTRERDDWGFSDADHAELQALIRRQYHRVPAVMIALGASGGVEADPHDPVLLPADMESQTVVCDGRTTRVFPQGAFWQALLAALRDLDDKLGPEPEFCPNVPGDWR